MDTLITLFLLGAILFICWGIIQLFRKGRRKRGLIYIAGAVSAVAVAIFVVGIMNERDARTAGFDSYQEQQTAEEAEQERRITEMIAQPRPEEQPERDRLDALARENGYESHAAQLAAQKAAEQAERERLAAQEGVEREAAEREAQEASEAAELTEEQARQVRLASRTVSMTADIAELVRDYYSIEAVPSIPNEPLCREDGYCDFTVGVFNIQVFGAGLAVVEPTSQASLTDYVEMCAIVFAAISGSEVNFAGEVVGLIYGEALSAGSAERDLNGVEVKFSPAVGGALGCRLFKY